jgi:hypothetical protein
MAEVVLYYNHSRGADQRPRKALRNLLNLLLRNVLVRPRYSPLIEAGLMVRLHLQQEKREDSPSCEPWVQVPPPNPIKVEM